MSTITKLEVNLSERYIPPVEPEEGSEEWCQDHLEDPRCEQYRPVDPDDPTPTPTPTPTPDAPETADTGHQTITQTDNFDVPISQNQLSAILFGGFCVLLLLAFAIPKLYNKFNKNRKNFYNLKKAPTFNKFRMASLSLAVLSLGASIFASVEAYIRPQDVDVISSEKVTINAEILNTDEIAYVHDIIRVPETELGFNLYATAGSTDLVDIHNPAHTIKSITKPGQLADNTYGIYIGKEAPTPSTIFSPIYTNSEQYNIYSTESTTEQAIDIWYAVRSKDNAASTYTVDIELRAIGKHDYSMQEITEGICAELEPGIMDYEFKDIRDGKIYTVGKYADGNCWMSQNLDLDLSTDVTLTSENTDLPEGQTWTPTKNTNVESDNEDWLYDEECLDGDLTKCNVYSYDSGIKEDGNYYNALSATAGTAGIEEFSFTYDTDGGNEETETVQRLSSTGSICPANWHLTTENEWMNMIGRYIPSDYSERELGGYAVGFTGPNIERYDMNRAIPSLDIAGIYIGDEYIADEMFGAETGRGIYKEFEVTSGDESKEERETNEYRLNSFARGVIGIGRNNKTNGENAYAYDYNSIIIYAFGPAGLAIGSSVRCVADYENFSLSFDENISAEGITADNIPSSYRVAVTDENKEKGVEYTLPSIAPTRSDGAEFLGWATSKNNAKNATISYYSGDKLMITGTAMKLYAVWDDGALIPHPHAIATDDGGLTFTYLSSPYRIGGKLDRHNPDSPLVTEIFDMSAEKDICEQSIIDLENSGVDDASDEYERECVPAWSPMLSEDHNLEQYKYVHIDESFHNYKPTSTAFWFAYMANLEAFTGLEYLDTSEVRSMVGMFMGHIYQETDTRECPAVIDLGNFDTRKVKDMTMMFMMSVFTCISGLENFKTDSLESTMGMFIFSIPAKPTMLDLSGWDMSNVKSIALMFSLAASDGEMGYIIKGIENWHMPSVLSIADAFFGATIENDHSRKTSSGEEILDLSNWGISDKTTEMNGAFRSTSIYNGSSIYSECENPDEVSTCERVTAVYDLSGWNTSNVTDMSAMFRNNASASKIVFNGKNSHGATGGWNVSNVTDFEEMFYEAKNLETVYVDKDWYAPYNPDKPVISTDMFGRAKYLGSNLIIEGGNGTKWNIDNSRDWTLARIDREGVRGYFTDACVLDDSCPVEGTPIQEQPGQQTEQQPPLMSYSPSSNYSYTPISEQSIEESTDESETETPVSTGEEKKSTKKSDTKSEQTEPLGVKKSVENASTVDTAVIAVIVASFVLVSAGAVIIFLIEKRRNEDEE